MAVASFDVADAAVQEMFEELLRRSDRHDQLLQELLLQRRTPRQEFREVHVELLQALDALADGELDFTVQEVFEAAAVDHRLTEALRGAATETPAALGALFRSLRNRDVAGLRLTRAGRAWRLART